MKRRCHRQPPDLTGLCGGCRRQSRCARCSQVPGNVTQNALYVIRMHCMLSGCTVCYQNALYVIRMHCMLSECTVCHQDALYVIRMHCMSSGCTVCHQNALYVIRMHCMLSGCTVCYQDALYVKPLKKASKDRNHTKCVHQPQCSEIRNR